MRAFLWDRDGNGRISIRVRLGALQELENWNAGTTPRLKFVAADMASKAVAVAEENLFFRSLVDRPALAGDRLHCSNMDPAKA
jgi:hypothetical protein